MNISATYSLPIWLILYLLLSLFISSINCILLNSIYKKYLHQQGLEFRENIYFGNKPILSEYDFIIIGGGTAGPVLANRLSENSNWTILLLEAGEDETIYQDIPLLAHYNSLTNYNWGNKYETNNEHPQCLAMNYNQCSASRGKGLGGSSLLNYMMYTRGNKNDYNQYEKLGNKNWNYENVLKYFIKSENNTSEYLDEHVHSTQGNLHVQNIPYPNILTEKFIQASCELGYKIYDYTGENPATEGFSKLQATIYKGQRFSSNKAYLKTVKRRTDNNLHISIQSHVSKILIDPNTKKATSVEFYKNGVRRVVLAKKEIILSAGAVGSPQILMLSGIGPKEHLNQFDIKTVLDLPGVGQNLQDHHSYFGLTFLMNKTHTGSTVEKKIVNVNELLKWLNLSKGPFTVPGGVTGIGYLNTKYNTQNDWPDTEYIFTIGSLNSDAGRIIRKSFNMRKDFYNSVYKNIDNREVWSIVPLNLRPKSRGYIQLKSKNPFKYPKIYYDFFQHEQDENVILEGIKNVLKISKTEAFQSLGSHVHNTPIPDCAQFTFGCDEYWKCSMRYLTSSLYHQSGTCKMGPITDSEAVVDDELRIHGIGNLRVIDASIFPNIPSAHLYAPTIMVAEKGSDMIKETWKNYQENNHENLHPNPNEIDENIPCYNKQPEGGDQYPKPNQKHPCQISNNNNHQNPCQLDNQKCKQTTEKSVETTQTTQNPIEITPKPIETTQKPSDTAFNNNGGYIYNKPPVVPNQPNFIEGWESFNASTVPNQPNFIQTNLTTSTEPSKVPNQANFILPNYPENPFLSGSISQNQPQYSQYQPQYPQYQPPYQSQPQYSQYQPQYPQSQTEYPQIQPQYPQNPSLNGTIPLNQPQYRPYQPYPLYYPPPPTQTFENSFPTIQNNGKKDIQLIYYQDYQNTIPSNYQQLQNTIPSQYQQLQNTIPSNYQQLQNTIPSNYQQPQNTIPSQYQQHNQNTIPSKYQLPPLSINDINSNENILFPYSKKQPVSNGNKNLNEKIQIQSDPILNIALPNRPSSLSEIPYYNNQVNNFNTKNKQK